MKLKLIAICALVVLFTACADNENSGVARSKTYLIHRANYNPVSGTAVVTELSPGILEIAISLANTNTSGTHPAHLHFGGVDEVGELAYALNTVNGETGFSTTVLDHVELSNGQVLDFEMLNAMNGSIKIHMNAGLFKHMVLAFGNIGKNEDYLFDGVAVCTGH